MFGESSAVAFKRMIAWSANQSTPCRVATPDLAARTSRYALPRSESRQSRRERDAALHLKNMRQVTTTNACVTIGARTLPLFR